MVAYRWVAALLQHCKSPRRQSSSFLEAAARVGAYLGHAPYRQGRHGPSLLLHPWRLRCLFFWLESLRRMWHLYS